VCEDEEGEGGDEGYGKDWTILSERKCCPHSARLLNDEISNE